MGRMAVLAITTEQLEREFVRVFGDGEHVPDKLWVETFHNDCSYIRAVYAKDFPNGAVDRLLYLKRSLLQLYGDAETNVAIVVFLHDAGWDDFAAHRLNIHLAR